MRDHKIRRLPVLNLEGELEGILSLNDIVTRTGQMKDGKSQINDAEVVKTYHAICEHPGTMTETPTEKTATAKTATAE